MSEQAIHTKRGLHEATVRHLALRLSEVEKSLGDITRDDVGTISDKAGSHNELRMQAMLDRVPDVIAAISQSGKIVSHSAATKRLLGYDPDELAGRNIVEFVHEDDVRAFHRIILGISEKLSPNA